MTILKDIKVLMELIKDHDYHNISDKEFAHKVKHEITLITSSFIGNTEAINNVLKIKEKK